ncbi:uncharacterized protein ACRADG_002847 [Cochliomyia hominivorax]
MKHSLETLIVLILSGIITKGFLAEEKEKLFQQKLCEFIIKRNAQNLIVYRENEQKLELPTSLLDAYGQEMDNWNEFYACLAQKPLLMRDMEKYYREPLRSASSISIYFIESYDTLTKVLAFLNPQQRWKHGHRYVFIWLMSDIGRLRGFFEIVWQKNILHAVAAIVKSQEIYTFEPFSSEGFRLKILNQPPYFYDKLKNFHRYKLRITMFKDSVRAVPLENYSEKGFKRIDGWVARTLVELINASSIYITPTDNETYGVLVNGNFTGSLKDIYSGVTHVGFNYRYTLDPVKPFIEELYPYKKRMLYLVVPSAEMRPEYLIFVNAFTNSLWRLLLLNFIMVLLIFIILQRLVERLPNHSLYNSPKHWRWYELVEMFIKTQLGEPVEGFSRISSLRQFLITWVLFSYVLTSIYFAKLESSFVHPVYKPELDNLEDLPKLKVPIYAYDVVFEAIKVSLDTKYYQYIYNNGIRVPRNVSPDDFFYTLAKKHKNVAIILHGDLAKEIVAHTYNDETKRPTFHIVKEYLRSLPSSYVLTKGSPFIHKFQTIVSSFFEYGFINHWLEVDAQQKNYLHHSEEYFQDLEENSDLTDNDEVVADTDSAGQYKKKVVLSMDILQGAFLLWVAGICLSCVGFALEILDFWHKRKGISLSTTTTGV